MAGGLADLKLPIGIVKARFDILGLGCAAVDELIYVSAYPSADAKTRVLRRERHCGGLTATALVAAARLGAQCAYAGVLGEDEASRFVLECLRREGIDVSRAVCRAGAKPIHSVIVVDERRRTRNVFFDVENVVGADAKLPAKKFIESARVLFVDNFGMTGMLRAARIARAAGIPVVADFEGDEAPRFAELLALVDHLILSENFALKLTGTGNPASAAVKLWQRGRSAVVVTCGESGLCFLDAPNKSPQHLPAFKVKAIDTTGCGDVFHGAYAAALARGLPLVDRVRFASAAAALKATRHGGQAGIPSLTAVNKFLKQHP